MLLKAVLVSVDIPSNFFLSYLTNLYFMISINLTIHQKEKILKAVLSGIFKNTTLPFEFIAVLDGCTDGSEVILMDFLMNNKQKNLCGFNILYADNLYETRCNNMAAKASTGDYVCIVQDDCKITEFGFDKRLVKPFEHFNDVFAVSGNMAHHWEINPNSVGKNADGWADLLTHTHHATRFNIPDSVFAVRDSCNRGPLMINRKDLAFMGYFPEVDKQDLDEHILIYEVKKKLNKVVGYYGVKFESDPSWGGTRDENCKPHQWSLDCQYNNTQLFYQMHSDILDKHTFENRNCE